MATISHFETHDVDDQAQALTGFRQFYEQLGRGRFHGSVWQLMMNEGFMLRESVNRSVREQFSPPPEHVTLALPLAVQPGSVFAGQPLGRESLMLLDANQEYELVSAGEFDLVGLSVHQSLLETLAPPEIEWLRHAQTQRHIALSPDAAAAIRQMLVVVSAQAERDIDSLHDAARETALLSNTLAQTVLLAMAGSEGTASAQIPRRADTRMRVVKRAMRYMREHLREDIDIPQICAAACASRRSLQYCFEEFLHTTPQACLRAMRLNEARRLLKTGSKRPIQALAAELGFASPSHFTRHYKLMFDELPSDTSAAEARSPRPGR